MTTKILRSLGTRTSLRGKLHLPFGPREIHTIRPEISTGGRSAVRRVQYEGRINSCKQARGDSMRSKRERRYYRSQVCPHLDGLERSSDAPSKKEKMIFYKKISFKGCTKLEFEPPRVKNDGNLEEVVPLLWCSERQILSVMEAERHMLNKTKNINDTEAWRLHGVKVRTNASSKASLA